MITQKLFTKSTNLLLYLYFFSCARLKLRREWNTRYNIQSCQLVIEMILKIIILIYQITNVKSSFF